MRSITLELPWDTFILEVASQTNYVVSMPVTGWRKSSGMSKARAWGEVRDFTLAGATALSAQMGLEFAKTESDTPVVVGIGPTFTGNGWLSPGATPWADVGGQAGEYLLARGVWLLKATLNPGTARPFLRAAGTVEIFLE